MGIGPARERRGRSRGDVDAEPHLKETPTGPDSTRKLQRSNLRAFDDSQAPAGNAQESMAQRHRDALAVCSRVLLSATDFEQIDEALRALLSAADATSIFIELNVDDPELGPCSTMVREVTKAGSTSDGDHWSRVPWTDMPDSHERMSRGEPFAFLISELGQVERATYDGADGLSELDVPFFVGHDWVGLIGLSEDRMERAWRPDEVSLMVAAAEMLAAFWERRESQLAAQEMASTTETALRYQQALVTCSRALLSSPDEKEALEIALEALTAATGIDYGFVERNEEVDGVGLCSRTVFEIDHSGIGGAEDPYWELVPWAKMPDSYARLSRGLPFDFTPEDLGPVERVLYESDPYPILSEIDIPILVEGSWEGLVGFSATAEVRRWTAEEVALLGTFADMIGSYWARRRSQETLNDLLRAKDAFLASVSHELRTPLTVVVGLAAELRDDAQRFQPEATREFIEIIAQQSSDLADLVDDLLVAARTNEDMNVVPSRIDLGLEASSVVESLGMDGVAVTGAGVAWADPARVRQIIRNLLTNASRYGGPNVEIEILSHPDRATPAPSMMALGSTTLSSQGCSSLIRQGIRNRACPTPSASDCPSRSGWPT